MFRATPVISFTTHVSIFHLHKIYFFYSSFLQMFWHLLGSGSFNSPKGLIACKQTSLPITFNGIELISITTIAPTSYLGSWALVISIIWLGLWLINILSFSRNLNMNWQQHISFLATLQDGMWSIALNPCMFFLHLNNSLGNKWFNFKIPSQSVCTIIPFPTCSSTRYLKPIMPKFHHVLARGKLGL